MKKLFLTSAILAMVAFSAEAKKQKGGFVGGPVVDYMSITEVQNSKDDTPVRMKGNIIENVAEEMYVFSDGTGVINVEIDDEDWNGQMVGATDVVEIFGEVDKGMWGPTTIDVETIKLVNQPNN